MKITKEYLEKENLAEEFEKKEGDFMIAPIKGKLDNDFSAKNNSYLFSRRE